MLDGANGDRPEPAIRVIGVRSLHETIVLNPGFHDERQVRNMLRDSVERKRPPSAGLLREIHRHGIELTGFDAAVRLVAFRCVIGILDLPGEFRVFVPVIRFGVILEFVIADLSFIEALECFEVGLRRR